MAEQLPGCGKEHRDVILNYVTARLAALLVEYIRIGKYGGEVYKIMRRELALQDLSPREKVAVEMELTAAHDTCIFEEWNKASDPSKQLVDQITLIDERAVRLYRAPGCLPLEGRLRIGISAQRDNALRYRASLDRELSDPPQACAPRVRQELTRDEVWARGKQHGISAWQIANKVTDILTEWAPEPGSLGHCSEEILKNWRTRKLETRAAKAKAAKAGPHNVTSPDPPSGKYADKSYLDLAIRNAIELLVSGAIRNRGIEQEEADRAEIMKNPEA